jgi:hypothetical protein
MAKPWTEKEDKLLRENYGKVQYRDLAKLINRSLGSVGKRIERLDLANTISKDSPQKPLKQKEMDKIVVEQLKSELEKFSSFKASKQSKIDKKGDTLVIHLTDLHAGKIVKNQEGAIIYNEDIFKTRIERLCEQTLKLLDNNIVKGVPITDVVILSTGDLCVIQDTLILTNEGLKPIQTIKMGQKVLTHTNRWQKVTKIYNRHISENIVGINTNPKSAEPDLWLTKNHPVWALPKYHNMLKLVNKSPEFIPAELLTSKHLVFNIQNSEFSKDINTIQLLDKSIHDTVGSINLNTIDVDTDFLTIIGLFIGDGSAKVTVKRGTVSFSLGFSNKDDIAKEILERWCKKYNIKFYKQQITRMTQYTINYKPLAIFFRDFYDKNKKKIIPFCWLNLPRNRFLYIIYGLILADGYISKRTIFPDIKISNTSWDLLNQIRIRLEYENIFCSIHITSQEKWNKFPKGKICFCNKVYELSFSNRSCEDIFKFFNIKPNLSHHSAQSKFQVFNYIAKYLKEIKEKPYIGSVYNLEVENDNSYIANGIVLHNCNGEGIYATQAYEQELAPPRQVMLCVEVISKLMKALLDRKLSVRFYGIRGNHGRTGKDTDVASNWDLMSYMVLDFWSKLILKNPKLSINYAETEHMVLDIRGHGYLIRHIAPEQVDSPSGRVKINEWARRHNVQGVVYGHYHHAGIFDCDNVRVFRGGSTVGGDSLSESMAKHAEPLQLVWGVNEARVSTFIYLVDLGEKK